MVKYYCEPSDVIIVTGITIKTFRLDTEEALTNLVREWIGQASALIDSYTKTTQDTDNLPLAIKNICIRVTANMVTFAESRKNSPLVKVNDWTVKTVPTEILTDDIREDLKPFTKESIRDDKSKIDILTISGD
jgi:hypothetical protein